MIMKTINRNNWERVILNVSSTLENNDIEYHLDGSTSLFAHGIDFEMDDLDITVKWGKIEKTRKVFQKYEPSQISEILPYSFKFDIDKLEVHVLTYEGSTGIGEAKERVQVPIRGGNRLTLLFTNVNTYFANNSIILDLSWSYCIIYTLNR